MKKSAEISKRKKKTDKKTGSEVTVAKKGKSAVKADKGDFNDLISKGKKKGYITYDELNEEMPDNVISLDRIDEAIDVFESQDIEIIDIDK
ncbi:MAG: RNA polymerase sigma factor region1.1 domain-containing protein, partial [Proteobacteria bacterium]|nr:RNA polymerase sigma factor region1.1 domain-containing protein [Pseudomonadota bacterium]